MVAFNEYRTVREEKLLVVRVQSSGCDQYRGRVRAHAGDLPRDGVFEIERYDGPDVVVRPQVEYERGVRDQEHDFSGPGGTLSPCDPAHLLHKERLILRMQIEFRFIDYQAGVPVIVQVHVRRNQRSRSPKSVFTFSEIPTTSATYAVSSGGQFSVSPGGQFRMSLDNGRGMRRSKGERAGPTSTTPVDSDGVLVTVSIDSRGFPRLRRREDRRGPFGDDMLRPRSALAGFAGRTWLTTSQSAGGRGHRWPWEAG